MPSLPHAVRGTSMLLQTSAIHPPRLSSERELEATTLETVLGLAASPARSSHAHQADTMSKAALLASESLPRHSQAISVAQGWQVWSSSHHRPEGACSYHLTSNATSHTNHRPPPSQTMNVADNVHIFRQVFLARDEEKFPANPRVLCRIKIKKTDACCDRLLSIC